MFSLWTGDDGPRYHWAIRMVMLLLGPPLGRSTEYSKGGLRAGNGGREGGEKLRGGTSRGRTTFSRVQWEVGFYGVRSSVFFLVVLVIRVGKVVGVVSFDLVCLRDGGFFNAALFWNGAGQVLQRQTAAPCLMNRDYARAIRKHGGKVQSFVAETLRRAFLVMRVACWRELELRP